MQVKKKSADYTTYCLFIGYKRSGHSIIGALLDAHPEIIISHELNALRRIDEGCERIRLFREILTLSSEQAKSGRREGNYSYAVPGQWQGKFLQLKVIGDKKGHQTTKLLGEKPWLFSRLLEVVRSDIRIIHVVRNPYDNISTILRYANFPGSREKVFGAINSFFKQAEIIRTFKGEHPDKIFEMKHEDFTRDPKGHLKRLCRFLGVEQSKRYLEDCAAIVSDKPNKSRFEMEWSGDYLDLVERKIKEFEFFQGYCFED